MPRTNISLDKNGRLLKEARLQLLKLHKILVDNERETFEKNNGQVTSGHFLNVLINDKNFEWLKKFSSLIVQIDEMFDLDDGVSANMIEDQLLQMKNLLELTNSDDEFRAKFTKVLQDDPEIQDKHQQLIKILSKK
ncbi:MAG: hypothetical protein M3521_06505 [Acidobacteriota bacterium]|nr:hypothetical protein [Acidobacteriota bacterium]